MIEGVKISISSRTETTTIGEIEERQKKKSTALILFEIAANFIVLGTPALITLEILLFLARRQHIGYQDVLLVVGLIAAFLMILSWLRLPLPLMFGGRVKIYRVKKK